MSKPIVWSFGGGTQTYGILQMIKKGKLPKPDLAIMANTGREATSTWLYLLKYGLPQIEALGIPFHIAPHDLATVDLYGKNGDLLIPAFTRKGKLPTFCSNEWKTRVVRRYLKALYGQTFECVMWLGMSIDEIERLKPADIQWVEHHWPLCNMPVSGHYGLQMSRADCAQVVVNGGAPLPPKSACKICPHYTNDRWQEMKEKYPTDFAEAVALDLFIRSNDQQGGVWLHASRIPLDEVDFSQPSEPTLFGCDSGFCWT